MGNYRQLTGKQRYQLAAYLEAGLTKQEIADFLGVHKTTVYRELARNQDDRGYYNADHAVRQNRRCQSNKVKARIGEGIWDTVEFQLRNEQWSPEQDQQCNNKKAHREIITTGFLQN